MTLPTFDLHEGDALSYLRERVPSASVDLICSDPPYASLEKHRKTGTTTRLKVSKSSSNVWFPVIENAMFKDYFTEFLRVLKPGRHFYMFCDPETSYALVPVALALGFKWGNRLIWDKVTIGMGYHFRRTYEDILFFVRPGGEKRRLANLGVSDILRCKRLKGDALYPTEKPCQVLGTLVQQSALPGELVLDPFCGSGSTGEAALVNGCRFLGIDITPEAVRRTRERLSKLSEGKIPAYEAPPVQEVDPEPVQEAEPPKLKVLAPPQVLRPLFGRPSDVGRGQEVVNKHLEDEA